MVNTLNDREQMRVYLFGEPHEEPQNHVPPNTLLSISL